MKSLREGANWTRILLKEGRNEVIIINYSCFRHKGELIILINNAAESSVLSTVCIMKEIENLMEFRKLESGARTEQI